MFADGYRPDRYDVTGALVCLAGVAVTMYAPAQVRPERGARVSRRPVRHTGVPRSSWSAGSHWMVVWVMP